MLRELHGKFGFGDDFLVQLWSFLWGLGGGSSCETCFLFLLSPPSVDFTLGYTFHTEDLDFAAISPRKRIINLFGIEFVHLLDVNGKTACSVQLSRTMTTLVVFRLLVLHEHFLILKLALAVPAPRQNHEFCPLFLRHLR